MNQSKSNSEQLHDLGIIDKTKLTAESLKAIDTMSPSEIGHLKTLKSETKYVTGAPVGIGI